MAIGSTTPSMATPVDISDAALFEEASAKPAPIDEAEHAPQTEADDKPSDKPRDEGGRFASKQPAVEPPAVTEPPSADADATGSVPSWRHREVSERARTVETENQTLRRQLDDMQRQIGAMHQRQAQPQKPADVPDPIVDPEGYRGYFETTMNDRLREMEANFSFRYAHAAHSDKFEKAYDEMLSRAQRGDPSVVRHVMASPDPGSALMRWHNRETAYAQVGDDPSAWFEKQLAERLKDQTFAGSLVEKIRSGASAANGANGGGNGANGQRPIVNLPPSLSRVPSARAADDGAIDASDAGMYQAALAAKPFNARR